MTHLPVKKPLFLILLTALAARLGTGVGRFIATFDRADAHFYLGLALMFAGLCRVADLGVALTVCGAILGTVGLLGATLAAQPAEFINKPTAPGAQKERR